MFFGAGGTGGMCDEKMFYETLDTGNFQVSMRGFFETGRFTDGPARPWS